MSWVIDNSQASSGSLVVLLMIANHCNKDGYGGWVGYETLAKESRMTRRNVMNCVGNLEKLGELKVEVGKGPHRTNLYSLPMMQGGEIFSSPDGENISRGGEIHDTKMVKPTSPKPSFKPSIKNINNKPGEILQLLVSERVKNPTRDYTRKKVLELLEAGATVEDFTEAINTARRATDEGFGIAYLEKIINRLIFERKNPGASRNEKSGRSGARYQPSGADIIADGLRRAQEAAAESDDA